MVLPYNNTRRRLVSCRPTPLDIFLIPHCIECSARSRLRGARGIYYQRGPFAADLQHLPLQRVQEKQWGQKDKLSRGERGYRTAVTE